MKRSIVLTLFIALLSAAAVAQKLHSPKIGGYIVPDDLLIQIVKAEDSRDAAPVIEMLTALVI